MLSPSLTNVGFEGFREPKAVTAGSEIHYFKVVNVFTLSNLRKYTWIGKILGKSVYERKYQLQKYMQ